MNAENAHRKLVTVLSSSYSEEHIFYDERTGEFSAHLYHCSSIDDAEWFDDGERSLTRDQVVEEMLNYNCGERIREHWELLRLDEEQYEAILESRRRKDEERKRRIVEQKEAEKPQAVRWLKKILQRTK